MSVSADLKHLEFSLLHDIDQLQVSHMYTVSCIRQINMCCMVYKTSTVHLLCIHSYNDLTCVIMLYVCGLVEAILL